MEKSDSSPQAVIRYPVNGRFTVQTMGHVRYQSPWLHFARESEGHILYFLDAGELFIEEDGVRWHIREHESFFLEANKLHRGYKAAPISYYYIHFSCDSALTPAVVTEELKAGIARLHLAFLDSVWSNQWYPGEQDNADLYFPKHARLTGVYNYFDTLREMDHIFFESLEGRRTLATLALQELIIMLCREFSRSCVDPAAVRTQSLARDIRLYLEKNYAEPITSRDIEREFHVNYDYANRVYKRYNGRSIHDYLIGTRIRVAQGQLSMGVSVQDTARLVGFEDAAYFSRLFKKVTWQTPSEYALSAGRKN